MTWFRLAYRLHRFELRLLLTAAALLVVGSIWVTLRLTNARAAELACIGAANALPTRPDGVCQQFQPVLDSLMTTGTLLAAAAAVAPFMLGLLLGVPLVASEIEARTAGIAWTLSPSRRRWLLDRLIPVLLIVGTALLLIGLAGDALARSYPAFDGADPGFAGYGMRGPLLAVRGVAVVFISVAVGAVIGRTLPALLVSGAVCLAMLVGLSLFQDTLMQAEAVPLPMGSTQTGASSKIYGTGLRDDITGQVISFDEYYAMSGADPMDPGEVPGMTMVAYQVPGSRYPDFVLREAAALGAVSLLFGGLAFVVVQRRRPY
jgi:hypothetical protein